MIKEKIALSVLIIALFFTSSCGQNKVEQVQEEQIVETVETKETTEPAYKEPHKYGGWYCPDNFGFPPMDIQELEKVPMVINRLPTKEETRNGSSLMFFDSTEYPNAKPMDMKLPRVARIYSNRSGMHELIIIIQAVVVENDSVVGFRYANGGNGTAWLDEVQFLSDTEVDKIGPSPFVYIKSDLKSSKAKVWKAITQTSYAKKLGQKFFKKAFFESDWKDDSEAHLVLESFGVKAKGIVTNVWGSLYLQIEYDNNGVRFSEKILVTENKKDNTAELHFVSGPHPENIEAQRIVWSNWLQEVVELSEKN